MSRATLADCLKSAAGSTRASIAVHIVREVASALHAGHGGLDQATGQRFVNGTVSPETILVRHDGGVELAPASEAARAVAARERPGYLAPEQVTGGAVDARADVFALGVVLWELLASSRLFDRGSAAETRMAIAREPIPDVREANPLVPEALAQVLATALERASEGRFQSAEAFGNALRNAGAAGGIHDATRVDLARWARERVPTLAAGASTVAGVAHDTIPDLDLPGAPAAQRPSRKLEAVKAPSSANIPAFDVNAMAAAALAPPPARSVAPAARAPSPGGAGGGREIAFETDDDDFDMQIERNVATTSMQHATSAGQASASPRRSGGLGAGLELAQPSRVVREGGAARQRALEAEGVGAKLLGALGAAAVAGATLFGLLRQVHAAGGRDVTRLVPHAFDGTSAAESGGVALVSLVAAVALGFVGLRLKPPAWTLLGGAGTILLFALAMVTVTLASTGENGAPPDGVLLVPYLFPAATSLVALGLATRSSRRLVRERGARRAAAIPLAAAAGLLAFVAFETSRLAR